MGVAANISAYIISAKFFSAKFFFGQIFFSAHFFSAQFLLAKFFFHQFFFHHFFFKIYSFCFVGFFTFSTVIAYSSTRIVWFCHWKQCACCWLNWKCLIEGGVNCRISRLLALFRPYAILSFSWGFILFPEKSNFAHGNTSGNRTFSLPDARLLTDRLPKRQPNHNHAKSSF